MQTDPSVCKEEFILAILDMHVFFFLQQISADSVSWMHLQADAAMQVGAVISLPVNGLCLLCALTFQPALTVNNMLHIFSAMSSM